MEESNNGTPLRLLLVEDSETDALFLLRSLSRGGYRVAHTRVQTRQEMLAQLNEQSWDLIVCDYNLPGFNAVEALRLLKETRLDIPFIVVSGILNTEEAVGLMRAGAQDFIQKNDLARLLPAVERELRDVENRRRGRDAEETVNRLAAAVEQAADMVLMTDPAGIIQYVNPAFERVTRYGREEVIGQPLHLLESDQPGEQVYAEMLSQASAGRTWKRRFKNRGKNGGLFEVEATVSPVRDPGGEIRNLVAVYRDISREVHLERQLRHSQKLEAVGTLAGGISHDFNNILGAIIGYTELCLGDVDEGSFVHRNLSEVFKAGLRARDLVAQLLTFSRSSDQMRQPINLAPIIKEALKFIRASFPTTIEIKSTIAPETGLVLVDPTQIHQVVMNLCTNAVQSMQETGGVLELILEQVHLDSPEADRLGVKFGDHVLVGVRDTGPGIPGKIRERIFDPFFTTKRVGEGSGLGLSVAHGIILAHGGAIFVDSHPGRGSDFRFFLPMVARRAGGELGADPVDAPRQGGGCVLFVDDEEALAGIGVQYLTKLGYEVVGATDSIEAWGMFRKEPHRFDALITDHYMPGLTGLDLARRAMELRPDLPVIICTGMSGPQIAERVRAQGIRFCLEKPLLGSDLAAALWRAMKERD